MGHGARGLQPPRYGLGVLPPRSRPLARVPLGRRRSGRHLGQPPAALLRRGALERAGLHPQGAPLRPDRQRGQSRRGRQGVLLLPRLHADAFLHEVAVQVPAGGVSLRGPHREEPPAGPHAAGVRAAGHRGVRGRPLLRRRRRVRQGHGRRPADPHHRDQPRAGGGPAARAADALVPQHLVVGRGRAAPAAARGGLPGRLARDRGRARHPGPALAQRGGRGRAAVHGERFEQAAVVGRAEHLGLRQGRLPRLRHRPPPRGGESGAGRDEGGRPLPAPDRRRRERHHLPAPDRRCADPRSVRQAVRRDCSISGRTRRTSSTRASRPRRSPTTPAA